MSNSNNNENESLVRVIPNDKLFVSEPPPEWFGNPENKENNDNWTNGNWLKSRFHFSFAEYREWANSAFGVLRVMNDDLVQGKRGFGEHGHSNMEIITYIVEGSLTHKDSMCTKETLKRGSIQFMTAGRGIRHSEFNLSEKPLRFIQTWITPRKSGLKQNYGSCSGSLEGRKNQLQHLVSNAQDNSLSTPVEIEQDCDAYVTELDLGKEVSMDLQKDRMAYLLCVEGQVKVNGKQLQRHDAAEIKPTTIGGKLNIKCTGTEKTETGEVAHVLLFTMKLEPGAGRTDF